MIAEASQIFESGQKFQNKGPVRGIDLTFFKNKSHGNVRFLILDPKIYFL
jgi:hypothetical protein